MSGYTAKRQLAQRKCGGPGQGRELQSHKHRRVRHKQAEQNQSPNKYQYATNIQIPSQTLGSKSRGLNEKRI
ncbi:unnamed protein product [Macrosiphum euphorbiae]|uniref:Uncharacterized protein n=1 Tax=Macrosiphum euphorbiae TaxID=13131 RepID=A0AAV0WF31_9HEMI|nr:unnamed protein product [Macrosiphum euphorbiae]